MFVQRDALASVIKPCDIIDSMNVGALPNSPDIPIPKAPSSRWFKGSLIYSTARNSTVSPHVTSSMTVEYSRQIVSRTKGPLNVPSSGNYSFDSCSNTVITSD